MGRPRDVIMKHLLKENISLIFERQAVIGNFTNIFISNKIVECHILGTMFSKGYVAPPLDGIWATAPYLHNGSVPTLDDLLKSSQRPAKWSRTFDNTADYDAVKIGWKYKVETTKSNTKTYDTTQLGYGNQGHIYGDKLTAEERKAVIEYLKTI